MNLNKDQGFTLIELLVVIAIIGILASILFVAINPKEQSDKARTTKLVTQFNQIEKAFLLTFLDENRSEWWTEEELDLGSNPTLKKIIKKTEGPLSGFSNYFPHEKIMDELTDSHYKYDNDNNDSAECGGGSSNWAKGVNIAVSGLTLDEKKRIDIYVDKVEDYKCGKITYGDYEGGSIYWRIVNN